MDAAPMVVLVIVLAVILVGGFLVLWKRDKDRSHEVAEDSGRFNSDPAQHYDDRGNPGR
ncbi:hypothetical protein [Nocardioides caldifontis]|uniref:hypothetical protein n=1 Tax=Nocardioides caldifontis TaxID=2588938 RepID=UPI0013968F84|nr:hypothetical protein [Nocardioides caldifontis]